MKKYELTIKSNAHRWAKRLDAAGVKYSLTGAPAYELHVVVEDENENRYQAFMAEWYAAQKQRAVEYIEKRNQSPKRGAMRDYDLSDFTLGGGLPCLEKVVFLKVSKTVDGNFRAESRNPYYNGFLPWSISRYLSNKEKQESLSTPFHEHYFSFSELPPGYRLVFENSNVETATLEQALSAYAGNSGGW